MSFINIASSSIVVELRSIYIKYLLVTSYSCKLSESEKQTKVTEDNRIKLKAD